MHVFDAQLTSDAALSTSGVAGFPRQRQCLREHHSVVCDLADRFFGVSAPLPGSSDEHRARGRISRAVDRGQQLTTEWEARIAVEVASEKLALMPRYKRTVWLVVALKLGLGVMLLMADRLLMASVFLFMAVVAGGAGMPLLARVIQPRLERARRVNADVVARGKATQ